MLEKIVNRIRTAYARPLAFSGALGLSALGAFGALGGGCDFSIQQVCNENVCVGDYQRDAGHGDAYDSRRAGGADAVVRNGHDTGRNADIAVPVEAGGAVFADADDAGYDAARDAADSAVYHDARADADAAVLIGDADVPDVPPPNPDRDDDGVLNEMDNCPDTPNSLQTDVDRDGSGDECDDEIGCVEGLLYAAGNVFLYDFQSGESQQVTNHRRVESSYNISWSPSNHEFAYLTGIEQNLNFNIKHFGREPETILELPRGNLGIAWSPDGTKIAYNHPDGNIYAIRPDGSENSCLTCDLPGEGYGLQGWASGSRLIALRSDGEIQRNVLIENNEETIILNPAREYLSWWGTGRLAFFDRLENSHQIVLCSGVPYQRCGSPPSTWFLETDFRIAGYSLDWSPDGTAIIYNSMGEEGREVDIRIISNIFGEQPAERFLVRGSYFSMSPSCNRADSDGDGVIDVQDNCPNDANPLQEDFNHDGRGDICTDTDNDGIIDANDNCPAAANAGQRDDDWNGVGRACDDVEREAPCLDGLVFSSTRLSPNADDIRFHLFRYHQLGENDLGLPPDTPMVLSMLGLQHDGVLHEPAAHPHGRFIAYTTVQAGFDRIFILNPGTRRSAELPIDVQGHHLANPLWAPDGASLFFLTGTAQRTDVYRAWRDGNVECVSCQEAVGPISTAFPYAVSPNTRYVAYPAQSEGRNGRIDLFVFDRIDEVFQSVSDGMEDDYFNVLSVAWHPSDNVFAYAAENFLHGEGSRRDLFLCRFAPGEPCRIGQNAQQVTRNANLREFYEMAWSPDGSLAVESAPVGGERRITIYRSFLQQADEHPDGALVQEEVIHRPGHDTQPSFFPGCDDRQDE